MPVFAPGERWVFPPGQKDVPPEQRTGYLLTVPSYFDSVAFRDRFVREIGPVPTELELLAELRQALPLLRMAEAERGQLDQLVARAVAAVLLPGAELSADDRASLDATKRRACTASAAFRGVMADQATRENLYPMEVIREFLRGWRGIVDRETGEPVELAFVGRDTGEPCGAEIRGRLVDARSLEYLPALHAGWLAGEVEKLSGPKGDTAKNWFSRSSMRTTPTTSSTAASGPRTTRRRMPKPGISQTSA